MKLEEYKDIAKKYAKEKNVNYNILGPLFRKENNILYLGYMIMELNDNNEIIRPHYWFLQNIESGNIIEFNDVKVKDFVSTTNLPLEQVFIIKDNNPIDTQIEHIKIKYMLWTFDIINGLNNDSKNKENELYLDNVLLNN